VARHDDFPGGVEDEGGGGEVEIPLRDVGIVAAEALLFEEGFDLLYKIDRRAETVRGKAAP
jgi:hypothetical protein